MGREAARRELPAVVRAQHLVCLSGPAGVGKSRLADEVASLVAPWFPDGVRWVDLAPMAMPGAVVGAVAKGLGVHEQAERPLVETLLGHLRAQRVLLILDNCDHVLAGCASLVQPILACCPAVSVLATSREPLGLAEEVVWPVLPLTVPDPGAEPVDASSSGEAVALFCLRAARAQPGFLLGRDSAGAVAEICRRLDGLPLAIELAAARVGVVPPPQIAALLGRRFDVLTAGPATAPSRQRTLRAAVEWSYDLLDLEERILMRRLGVFTGGWTLAGAEAIGTGSSLDRSRVLDALAVLVAKSMVVADTSGAEARYRFLETMRVYAVERLDEAGETEVIAGRHASWCLNLAECAEPELTGSEQRSWLDRLEAEHGNLQSAFGWLTAAGEAEQATRLASALTLFWRVRGYGTEGRAWLATALATCSAAPRALQAKVFWGAGFLARMVEDPADAGLLEQALSAYREVGDLQGAGRALLLLGNCAVVTAPVEALQHLQESVALARQTADAWCLSHALGLSALARRQWGDTAGARVLLEESVTVARRAQDTQGLRLGLAVLGDLLLEEGDCRAARALHTEVLGLVQDLGDVYGVAVALYKLGDIAITLGDWERARQQIDSAIAAAHAAGNPAVIHNALCCLGRLEIANGHLDAAAAAFESAAHVAGDAGQPAVLARLGLSRCLAASGDSAGARDLLEQILEAATADGNKRVTARALRALGELAQAEGDAERATNLSERALKLFADLRDIAGIVDVVQTIGGLVAVRNPDRAARLYGAAQAIREARGYVRAPDDQARCDASLREVRERLTGDRFVTAWTAGTACSPEQAVADAMCSHPNSPRPPSGWAALTPSERQVAILTAEGLTNPEIAERLIVSRHTVHGHLSHIFSKLGISSRRELPTLVGTHDT